MLLLMNWRRLLAVAVVFCCLEAVRCVNNNNNAEEKAWHDDMSGVFDYRGTTSSTGRVKCTAADTGTGMVYNSMYMGKGGMIDGIYTWNVTFEFGSEEAAAMGFGVGVTSPDYLRPSYAVRGMYFNGLNLSNGGALLRGNYGRCSHTSGAVLKQDIVMLVDLRGSRVNVWFVQDGMPLGLAYHVPKRHVPFPLYPAISFGGRDSKASVVSISEPLSDALRDRRDPYLSHEDPILGNWRTMAVDKSLVQNLPKNAFLLFTQGRAAIAGWLAMPMMDWWNSKKEVMYSINTQVVNQLSVQLTCEIRVKNSEKNNGKTVEGEGRIEGERKNANSALSCTPGVVTSTRMTGPEDDMAFEQGLSAFLHTITSVKFSGGTGRDNLILNGGQMVLERYAKNFRPIEHNPFSRAGGDGEDDLAVIPSGWGADGEVFYA